MSRPKNKNLFVIFAIPQQYTTLGTLYYAKDASVTGIKPEAARFYLLNDAKSFAIKNNIKLTDVTYIGLETFSDFELSSE